VGSVIFPSLGRNSPRQRLVVAHGNYDSGRLVSPFPEKSSLRKTDLLEGGSKHRLNLADREEGNRTLHTKKKERGRVLTQKYSNSISIKIQPGYLSVPTL